MEENNEMRNVPALDLSNADPKTLCERIITILDEKKAQEIKVLKVCEQTVIADYFVMCSGTSNTNVNSLAGELEFKLQENGVKPIRTEGENNWIILDYASVLVHIFGKEAREFYNLEKLWSEAEEVDISGLLV